jgi:poly(beta-D-mannuronate) lyase
LLSTNACQSKSGIVHNIDEFDNAVAEAKPGDKIVLANGIWKDVELVFKGIGEEGNPIMLTVEEKGKVILTGLSNLRIGGEYLHVEGLVFKDGHTPTSEVISFKIDKETLANHSRVTECVIDDYNPAERYDSDYWVGMYGKHNRFDHNYLVNKRNQGVTIAVRLNSKESIENHHQIDHNYFGYHPILGSNGGETMRIGTSHYSMSNSNTIVEFNYFDKCNGEHEIISNKSCQNTFRNNTFNECQGTLTMRHGNETLVENNFFFGNRKANTGGIRIINESQIVRNNYMEGLTGYRFRGALVIMNGVPNSPLNRYFQVKNSSATNNTIVDCDYIQLCAGSDEERSATPVNTTMSDNLIVSRIKNDVFTVYDDVSGIEFKNNVLSKNIDFPFFGKTVLTNGFVREDVELVEKDGIQMPTSSKNYGVNSISERATPENTGVSWYKKDDHSITFDVGRQIVVEPGENTILDAIESSQAGDIIVLSKAGSYHLTKSIDINHTLTIRAAEQLTEKPFLSFERRSLFNIENGGSLKLEGVHITGKSADDMSGNSVIRTSRYSMINNYKLIMNQCDFTDLDVNHSFDVFRVFKNTFADSIVMNHCTVKNISGNVMALDQEIDDIGIYNAENVVIANSSFEDIGGVVLDLHRGGRDESTFGPILDMTDTSFKNVGFDQRNAENASVVLHGVQLANINNLTFDRCKKLNLHLIVGDPVIKIANTSFKDSEGITSNSDAYQSEKISYNK